MEKVLVAKTVANKLMAAETSIDEALVKAAALLSGLIEAKAELNLSATVGDDALAEVTKAIATLSASRSAMVLAHRRLDETRLRMGIRTTMVPISKDGQPFAIATGEVEMRQAG